MPQCWPAGSRHTLLPSRGQPHWQRPCSGRPSRLGAGAHPGTDTDPETGVACQLVLCWLYPAGRLAHGGPVRPCPAEVSCAGCVLPSRPSPCSGLSPPLSTMRDTTPQGHPAGCPPSWPRACTERVQEPLGLPKFFDISLPACRGLWTPADRPLLAKADGPVLPSGALKPSASATSLFEAVPALQGARSPLRPTGYSVYASPILFAMLIAMTPPWTQDSIRVGG